MQSYWIGYDIGGTKCAVLLGSGSDAQKIQIADKIRFATRRERGWQAVLRELFEATHSLLQRNAVKPGNVRRFGVSCGGPLDSKTGVIYSPPNLPDWDAVPIAQWVTKEFGVPCSLQNDANACALAEWRFGAGRGTQNMLFLTFGTGMGAGLILNGHLYSGTNDLAGEVGHLRLAPAGPLGYGKQGSFEGFCSGGGIADLARNMAKDALFRGETPVFCPNTAQIDQVNAQSVANAAFAGDSLAREVFRICGDALGKALALLVDILNPQAIVIGSIYERSGVLLEESMRRSLETEALPGALAVCRILPAQLGDGIGDYAALGVAAAEN